MKDELTSKKKPGRPMLLFYLLVIYIFSSFTWWSYLLAEKNKMAFAAQVGMELVQYNYVNGLPDSSQKYYTTPHYYDLDAKYRRQRLMIISEGAVFLLLLAIGAITIYGTFTREVMLARQQNNFLLSITHELKSPLASIKLSLQTIVKRLTLEEKFSKLIGNSIADVDRLEMLVDNILLAAKVESSSYSYNLDKTDLSAMITDLLERLKVQYAGKEITYHIPDEIIALIDKLTFSSVIINVVENAIKYSPAGEPVEVSMHRQDKDIIIEIKDNGIGIPDTEKRNIFGKFYRIGSEATRTSKGTGLGLFIVRRVLTDHGGGVQVFNNTPKGSIFKINLPASV